MITQTPSPNKTTPTKQREPLRWLIPAALLLLFLSICCIGQVVIVILSPRDEASDLNLLSKDLADYSPWKIQLRLPPIAPGAAAAEAADRATEAALAVLSPTPLVLANIPTSEVIVIAAPQNAPTNTPGSALITPQPTVTPRPVLLGPTDTPVISTVEPGETTIASLATPTDTIRPASPTQTPAIAGGQPTRTSTPAPSTATTSPVSPATPTATRVPPPPPATSTAVPPAPLATNTAVPPATNTAVPPPPPATNTAVPPPPATNTAVPPPPRATNTSIPPTVTNTPVLPPPITNTPVTPTKTNTPVPPTKTNTPVPPTATNTPVPPTATNTATATTIPPTATDTATATTIPPTATNTATATTIPPTNTPTVTPTPTCAAVPGTLTIVKFEANNTYIQGPTQPIDFTICIINATGAPVAIQGITDTLPTTWQWDSLACDMSGNPDLACAPPAGFSGGTMAWGHQVLGQSLIMNPGDRIDLRIHGRYSASGQQCNGPEAAGIGYQVTLADTTVLSGNPACISVP